MASKTVVLPRTGQQRLLARNGRRFLSYSCPACSRPITSRQTSHLRPASLPPPRRTLSTHPGETDPRNELKTTLIELERRSPNLINLSRLQLALQGLREDAGEEVVRVAVFGVGDAGATARRLVKALLTDPLQDEQPWEKQLQDRDSTKPLIVRVNTAQNLTPSLEIARETAVDEMHISLPELNAYNLEFLLMDITVPLGNPGETTTQMLEETVLVPTVEVPSAEHRVSPMSTPVHRALLVADGLLGAVNISALPLSATDDSIVAAVQLEAVTKQQLEANFDLVDVSLAEQGINLFRMGPQNARDYEQLWFSSNLPRLMSWLKAGARSTDQATKPAVRQLIASLLGDTMSAMQEVEARRLSRALSLKSDDPAVAAINKRLAEWAQMTHAELQEELDLAFSGRRWRKLGWWKLFWRVDDVAMLTTEMLSQRFMPHAEQELVYLAGRITQVTGTLPEYPQPSSAIQPGSALPKWPGHIAFTRRYLQNETVPALQSLAQKLVMQAIGTSGIATTLAGLLYVSSFAPTVYGAGSVATLGIVYALGRMQKKWETARGFWEGEVREEGRKAVRAAEESVADVLLKASGAELTPDGGEDVQQTKDLVARAEDALARMK